MRSYFQLDSNFNQTYGITKNGNTFLTNAIKHCRSKRPLIRNEQEYTIMVTDPYTVQLWIRTTGCAYSKAGSCSFCDYWIGRPLEHPEEVVEAALTPYRNKYHTLIFNTCGSPMDYAELTASEQERIWRVIDRMGFSTVIIETHMNTLDARRLEMLRDCIRADLVIEVGLESSSQVATYALNKQVDLHHLKNAINLIHSYGMSCCVNVILGAPFLSIPARMEDAACTVRDALRTGADSCVLFPINVKEYTLVHFLAEHGMYQPVCGWEFLTVLDVFWPEELERLYIAWYQEREQNNLAYTSPIRSPSFCTDCSERVHAALAKFSGSRTRKKEIISRIMQIRCGCRQRFEKRLADEPDASVCMDLASQYDKLRMMLEVERNV